MRTTGTSYRRSVVAATAFVILIMLPHAHRALLALNDDLDPTFGKEGKVRTDFLGRSFDFGVGLALQPDGRIVTVGSVENFIGIARHLPNGALDPTFGTLGRVITAFDGGFPFATAVAVQRDNKIVVAGTFFPDVNAPNMFALARYNTNGSLDTTFGVNGKVTTKFDNASVEGKAIAIRSDGKIVVVGQAVTDTENVITDMAVARYNTNGSLDSSFDGDGRVTADLDEVDDARAVAVTFDGKIVVAGSATHFDIFDSFSDFAVLRFRDDGSPDPTFGIGGRVRTDLAGLPEDASAVMIQRDGKIVATGTVIVGDNLDAADIGLVRYNPNGSLDVGFGAGGVSIIKADTGNDFAQSGALQRDGKIVVGSTSGKEGGLFTVMRVNTNGTLDLTFGTDGVKQGDFSTPDNDPIDELHSIAIQADGKIVAAGFTFNFRTNGDMNFALLRFQGDGFSTTEPH